MQGSSDPRVEIGGSVDEVTPIYSAVERQYGDDFMDSFSLRRDLTCMESPPFGAWWTFTVEETLVWPILAYKGDINVGLDALLDLPDGDEENGCDNGVSRDLSQWREYQIGLDDGQTVQRLIGDYLRHIHTQNHVLDPNEVRCNAKYLVENGLGWDDRTCQVLLVCALGAVSYAWDVTKVEDFSREDDVERRRMGEAYFKAAQRRTGVLFRYSSLTSAQCHFLFGLYFAYAQEPVPAWRAFNSATIACRAFASQRVARQRRHLHPPNTRSLEQRLFWSCIKSEREIACEFGMETSGLNQLAYSTTLPSPPSSYTSEMNNVSGFSPSSLVEPAEDESWFFYLTELMLRKLQMRIDIFAQDKRREAYRRAHEAPEVFFGRMVAAQIEFGFQLTRYYETLPPVMQFSLDDLSPSSNELKQFLRFRVICVKHDILFPAIYVLVHNDVSGWPAQLVAQLVQLANACISIDVRILQSGLTSFRHQATWLTLRTAVRSALILIAMERLAAKGVPGLEDLQAPDSSVWQNDAENLVKKLVYWSSDLKDCRAYIEILAKLHPVYERAMRECD